MPLRLVLGPANARKVGRLLDAHEDASRAGRTAWFVVPSSPDVERFQRELAGVLSPPGRPRRSGVPFGVVMDGSSLERQLLKRLGSGERLLSRDHRKAVALAAIRRAMRNQRLLALAPAARSRWLADELIGLSEELGATGYLGGRAEAALQAWSAQSGDARGDELAALLRFDSRLLATLEAEATTRRVDRARAARIVSDAVRAEPGSLDDLHLVLSGFDDLDPVQRMLVLSVARSGADVVLSLPFQAGREALSAAGGLVDYLAAADPVIDDRSDESGAGTVRPELAEVERRLYEQVVFQAPAQETASDVDDDRWIDAPIDPAHALGPLVPYDDEFETETGAGDAGNDATPSAEAPAVAGEPPVPVAGGSPTDTPATGDAAVRPAVVELRGGGPAEEDALIAEHVAALIAAGCLPASIAIAVASPATHGPSIEAALRRAGVAAHIVATRKSRAAPSVAALVALLDAVADGAPARNLVDWLAGPGGFGGPGGADALDATVRRRGAGTVREALSIWRWLGHGEVEALTALWDSQKRGSGHGALEGATAAALRTRLTARMAEGGPGGRAYEWDLRTAAAVLTLLEGRPTGRGREGGLVDLARDFPDLGLGVDELRELIAELPAPADLEPAGSVAIVGPLGVRTRYLDVVVIARAQRGAYPADEPVRRILTSGDRAALKGHGWPSPARPEHAASERYLAYEVVARPTAQLVVAWHDGDGDGKPREPSPLVAEVRRAAGGAVVLGALPSGSAARHALPRDRRERIAAARAGRRRREPSPGQSPLLAAQDRDRYAVGALQTASRCAAQWFVDHHLRPRPLSPDAAPLTAGRLRHEILAEVVRETVGAEPLGPEAVAPMRAALAEAAGRLATQGDEHHETLAERLMRERVIAEIDATVPGLCGLSRLEHQPTEFELAFGTVPRGGTPSATGDDAEDDLRPPVTIERAGETLVLAGRIDRLDASPADELVVVDYKGSTVDQYRGQGWIEARELQAGLYALVAERLMGEGSRAVASLYQPVPGPLGQAARGASARDLTGRAPLSRTDRVDPAGWDELLDALVGLAADAQRLIDDGIARPDPGRCSPGGCRYPWLCREVQP